MNRGFDCRAAASMLDGGRVAVMASHTAVIVAALTPWSSPGERVLYTAVLALWPVVCWLGLRVAIDASLFRAMANDPDDGANALDRFLVGQKLGKPRDPRPIEERIGAALRLWRTLLVIVSVQVLSVIVSKAAA